MNKKKNIYSKAISWCFSLLIFVICLFISIKVIIANKEGVPPAIFGYSISEVPTESMEPTIYAGDYIIFHSKTYNEVKLGDIIVYRSKDQATNGMFIIHRVISIEDGYLVTKGDNNVLADSEQITSDMVFGEYKMTICFLNFLGNSGSRQSLFMVLMALLLLIIIMQAVSIYVKSAKEHQKEKLKAEVLKQMKDEILEEELRKMITKEKNEKK